MEQSHDQYRYFFTEFPEPLLLINPVTLSIKECNKATGTFLAMSDSSINNTLLTFIPKQHAALLKTCLVNQVCQPLQNVPFEVAGQKKFLATIKIMGVHCEPASALIGLANIMSYDQKSLNGNGILDCSIIDALPFPICLRNATGEVVYYNAAYQKYQLAGQTNGAEVERADQPPGEYHPASLSSINTHESKSFTKKEVLGIAPSRLLPCTIPGETLPGTVEVSLNFPSRLHDNTLMQILNVMPQNVYLKDDQGKFLLVNQSTAALYNLTPEDMVGKSDRDFYTLNQALEFQKIENDIIQGGVIRTIPEEFSVDNNGVMKVKSVTKMPYFIQEINQVGILGINTDITDAKLSEKALKESELKYKMLMEQASDGIYLSDQDGNVVDANHKACEMFGYNLEEFTKLNIKKLIDPKESFEIPLRTPEIKDKQSIIMERRFLKKDGSPFTVELSAKLLGNGRHQAIIRDITERKRLERILKDNEKKFRALIENSSDLIIIVSESFKIRFISASVKRILGYEPDDVLGKSAFEFIHGEEADLISKIFSQALIDPGKKIGSEEIRMRSFNEAFLYFEIVAVNLLVDPNINGIILNCHDITKRKITEIELLNTNFELDSFVYKASHDLKAPLRSVMGLIKLAKYESHDTNLNAYLDLMQKSVTSLDTFIKDLTQFSRNSRLDIEAKSILFEDLITESFHNLRYMDDAERVEIMKDIHVTQEFYSDITRISTIINNLLSNAYKYHRFENNKPFIKITVNAGEDRATIIIEDNGAGIDPIHIDKIFEMFYRASESSYGSGLGLYIVKNAVNKLNGIIEVESKLKTGTKFLIIIPNLFNKK